MELKGLKLRDITFTNGIQKYGFVLYKPNGVLFGTNTELKLSSEDEAVINAWKAAFSHALRKTNSVRYNFHSNKIYFHSDYLINVQVMSLGTKLIGNIHRFSNFA